jgi:TIGR03009 family protein
MRNSGLVLGVLLLCGAAVSAQQPPQQPYPPQPPRPALPAAQPLNPNDPLDQLLLRWEGEMKKVQTLVASLNRIDQNKVAATTDVYVGVAKYMRAQAGQRVVNLATLELRRRDQPDSYEKMLCNGTGLYLWSPTEKEIRMQPLPQPKPGQVADDGPLQFLLGMKAEEARRRYELKLTKSDQYYYYVDVLPRFDQDKADFQRARMVLNKDSFLPRQLWFEQPNGNTVTWDIPKIENGAPLNTREFDTPTPPAGWKMAQPSAPINDAPSPPPRVIRGGEQKTP